MVEVRGANLAPGPGPPDGNESERSIKPSLYWGSTQGSFAFYAI